jgi:thiosulfate/3-mercaptopyruvate sulfurtransferase
VTLKTPLISAQALSEALRADPAALLDVRWELGGPPGREEYLNGHIPGAVYVDLDAALAGPAGRAGRHPMPAAEDFAAAMRAAGVSLGRPVVVYDAGPSVAAARAWWMLRYFGHPHVAVLDGGFAAWVGAGLPVESGAGASTETGPGSGDFVAGPGGMPLLDADGAAALARTGVLVDARAPARFRGEQEPVDPVAGHIPGAVNLPSSENVDDAGRFLAPEVLRARFERGGVRAGLPVGAYCGSGVSAANEVLALALGGYAAALYVGSWSEWITDPRRAVAVGPPEPPSAAPA